MTRDQVVHEHYIFHHHRLSDRVTYEQQLANMYLYTSVSKESLGQACHQYLIQPLAKVFTSDGEITIPTTGYWMDSHCIILGGDKQITDLIGQYLQCMLCPSLNSIIPVANGNHEGSCDRQLDTNDWVVMSRIRCMCRLLVDCSSFTTVSNISDSTATTRSVTATNTNATPKGFKKGTPSLLPVPTVSKYSSDSLVQCWKSIVKKQLQEVLGILLSDNKPHSVATGLINIYIKLKCAMRELFGGHSRYAIALKEGFAEQLQALSEPHSIQVKETFLTSKSLSCVLCSFVSHFVPQLIHCSMSLDQTTTISPLPWKQKGKPY